MEDINADRIAALYQALTCIEADLSLPLLLTLVAVAREPGLSITELAERIEAPQQTASRYVAVLQGRYQLATAGEGAWTRQPLLSLEISVTDPRRRALFLTAHGQARLAEVVGYLYPKKAAQP